MATQNWRTSGRRFERRAQAARADLEAERYAVHDQRLVLDVGLESTVRLRSLALPASRVLMPDVAAVGCRLTAEITPCQVGFSFTLPYVVARIAQKAW